MARLPRPRTGIEIRASPETLKSTQILVTPPRLSPHTLTLTSVWLRVLESEPPGTFDRAALDAVNSWRFEPATYEGLPVAVRVRQVVRFELE